MRISDMRTARMKGEYIAVSYDRKGVWQQTWLVGCDLPDAIKEARHIRAYVSNGSRVELQDDRNRPVVTFYSAR